jgi:enterochelin esterase-like enzyme
MPLLGWPLLVVLSVLALLSVAAVMLLWTRVPGGSLARASQRVALVVAAQVTAILLVAAAVNDYGYFYGSWTELLGGAGTAPPAVTGAGVQAGGPADHRPMQPRVRFGEDIAHASALASGWSTPTQWPVRGRLQAVELTGTRSALSEPVLVYLPPQYFQRPYARARFPAAEVMTGYPGTTANLVNRLAYPDVLRQLVATHQARPMVLVLLRPTVAPPRDTECTDVPGGPLAMTYLAEDVPTTVDRLFRVRPLGWGVVGDSTGGYCAVKMALTHSDVFSAAVSLSGYYHTLADHTTGSLWGGSMVMRHLNDPEWLLAHEPPPPVSLLLTEGTAEGGSLGVRDTRRFLSLVRPPLHAEAIMVPDGGHNFADWGSQLPTALTWLSARLG